MNIYINRGKGGLGQLTDKLLGRTDHAINLYDKFYAIRGKVEVEWRQQEEERANKVDRLRL